MKARTISSMFRAQLNNLVIVKTICGINMESCENIVNRARK
jgi:hypothetical protein